MKRKQYRYYWETSLRGCFNIFAAVVTDVNGENATRFYSKKRKVGEVSHLHNGLWEEWAKYSYNKGILFRITKKQFQQFQDTGKYPVDKNLK